MANENNELERFLQDEAEKLGKRARRVAANQQGADRPRPSRQQERQMLSLIDDVEGDGEIDTSASAASARASVFGEGSSLSSSTETQHQELEESPMRELLRNPQTLRTAFIASQIFERKF